MILLMIKYLTNLVSLSFEKLDHLMMANNDINVETRDDNINDN